MRVHIGFLDHLDVTAPASDARALKTGTIPMAARWRSARPNEEIVA
jgi:hypothetical protein